MSRTGNAVHISDIPLLYWVQFTRRISLKEGITCCASKAIVQMTALVSSIGCVVPRHIAGYYKHDTMHFALWI